MCHCLLELPFATPFSSTSHTYISEYLTHEFELDCCSIFYRTTTLLHSVLLAKQSCYTTVHLSLGPSFIIVEKFRLSIIRRQATLCSHQPCSTSVQTSIPARLQHMPSKRGIEVGKTHFSDLGRVANPRPVARIKTSRVAQPITDAADATGLGFATRPWCTRMTPRSSWSLRLMLSPLTVCQVSMRQRHTQTDRLHEFMMNSLAS